MRNPDLSVAEPSRLRRVPLKALDDNLLDIHGRGGRCLSGSSNSGSEYLSRKSHVLGNEVLRVSR